MRRPATALIIVPAVGWTSDSAVHRIQRRRWWTALRLSTLRDRLAGTVITAPATGAVKNNVVADPRRMGRARAMPILKRCGTRMGIARALPILPKGPTPENPIAADPPQSRRRPHRQPKSPAQVDNNPRSVRIPGFRPAPARSSAVSRALGNRHDREPRADPGPDTRPTRDPYSDARSR